MPNNDPASLEAITKIAERRRNEIRQSVESLKAPDFLLAVLQTEVSYVFHPRALPYDYVVLEALDQHLRSLYSLEREKTASIMANNDNPLQDILSGGQPQKAPRLSYIRGKFPLTKKDFIPIKSIDLTSERVHIILKGDSSIAEALVADITESLWTSAGANKSWDLIKPSLQMVAYGTATKVNLDVPLEQYIHPALTGFMQSQCLSGKRYAASMRALSTRTSFQPQKSDLCTYAVDDLNFRFSIFDPLTGRSEQSALKFTVTAKDEYGTGIYTVISELPYDTHMQLIDDLVVALKNASV